jgi:AcrR family transcriptional regulator
MNAVRTVTLPNRTRKQPVAATQARAQDTRKRLIEAAVASLTRYGFGGATMARISKMAGVSAGPRQYYFPTTAHLFAAVLDHLLKQQGRVYSEPPMPKDADEHIRELIRRSINYAGTPNHIAILEIKLALKHDSALRQLVAAKLDSIEAQADLIWIEAFKPFGADGERVQHTRRILASISRGLALDGPLAPMQQAKFAEIVETMAFASLTKSPGQ